jgi:hypothetical protein
MELPGLENGMAPRGRARVGAYGSNLTGWIMFLGARLLRWAQKKPPNGRLFGVPEVWRLI